MSRYSQREKREDKYKKLLDEAEARDAEKTVELQSLGADLNTALARVAAEQRRLAEEQRRRAEETLTLLAAARAVESQLDARLSEALIALETAEGVLAETAGRVHSHS